MTLGSDTKECTCWGRGEEDRITELGGVTSTPPRVNPRKFVPPSFQLASVLSTCQGARGRRPVSNTQERGLETTSDGEHALLHTALTGSCFRLLREPYPSALRGLPAAADALEFNLARSTGSWGLPHIAPSAHLETCAGFARVSRSFWH